MSLSLSEEIVYDAGRIVVKAGFPGHCGQPRRLSQDRWIRQQPPLGGILDLIVYKSGGIRSIPGIGRQKCCSPSHDPDGMRGSLTGLPVASNRSPFVQTIGLRSKVQSSRDVRASRDTPASDQRDS